MAAKVAAPLSIRRDVRGRLGRPPGGRRSGLLGALAGLCWGDGAGRLVALTSSWPARARVRNRFGGRSATKDDELAEEEEEEETEAVVIVDGENDEEFGGDDLSGFRGLVLDLSYRPVNVVCWKRAICLEFMAKLCRPMYWRTTNRLSLHLVDHSTSLQFCVLHSCCRL